MKIIYLFLLSVLLTISVSSLGQSEIVITHDGDRMNPMEGIVLSEISYPLVRIKLASEAVRQRYPSSEITLVRNDRAVAQARFHGSSIGERNSLRQVLSQAKAGDKILIRLRGSSNSDTDKTITIPLK